jgi:type VI protein secretion system component VasK
MRANELLAGELTLTGEGLFLVVAIALAIIFVGLLVLDLVKRRRRKRRHRRSGQHSEESQAGLLDQMRDVQAELKRVLHQRSSRQERRHRRRPPDAT